MVGQVLVRAGVAAAEEMPWADDREAHRVLLPIRDPLRSAILGKAEYAVVGRGIQRAVGGIDAEAVHVRQPGFRVGLRVGGRLLGLPAGREGGSADHHENGAAERLARPDSA
ncbi:hypothetical protein ACFSVJ_28210 [Prauserella oleivorans]